MSNQTNIEQEVHILSVDDMQANLIVIEGLLEDEHYHLVSKQSGEEALQYLFSNKVALILLDVNMPGMDGFKSAQLMRKLDNAKDTPIVFITATHLSDEKADQASALGVEDYLLKPIDPDTFIAKVSTILSH